LVLHGRRFRRFAPQDNLLIDELQFDFVAGAKAKLLT
jgi:hypothetical protein